MELVRDDVLQICVKPSCIQGVTAILREEDTQPMCSEAPSTVFSQEELSRADIDRSHKKLVISSKADKIPSNNRHRTI